MNIKVYYRRNLKMSEGKLAAQVGHCVIQIALNSYGPRVPDKIVVLKASDVKFEELKSMADHVQVDLGYTEVDPNTETVLGIVYEE
jgi:peptidyl-tRNA hydrolase